MDQRFNFRKGYDTDLLILRSIFALDPDTNKAISSFYAPVADGIGGVQWLSLTQYFSSGTGILDFVSSVESFSTQTGLYSNFSSQTTEYVSTQTINALNTQVSSISFYDTDPNYAGAPPPPPLYRHMNFSAGFMYVDGSLFYNPSTVLTNNLVSTTAGLGTAGYISSSQFLSTINRLGANGLGYVNTPSLVSTTSNLQNQLTSTSAGFTVSSAVSLLNLIRSNSTGTSVSIISTGKGALDYTNAQLRDALPSTLIGLGTYGYISSSQLISTVAGLGAFGNITIPESVSTVAGLGTIGYVSTASLVSTVAGLGGAGIVITSNLVSTTIGLGTLGYISSSQLQSTILGLGGTGLVSTGQLVSSVNSIVNVLDPANFTSTVRGLGTIGYVSSSQLVSTTIGLLAAITPATGTTVGNLVSTVAGLGTIGYVSTGGLGSTVVGLQNSFLVVNASQVFVNNSRISISSVGTFIFFSTFMNSSITYQGNNGNFTGSNAGVGNAPLYFSSATLNLDRWSSFINAQSIITIDLYPTFYFANLGLTSNPSLIYMSTFLQAGGSNFTSSFMFQSAMYPTTYSNNQSNRYYQPMKITMPGSVLQGFYPQPMRLAHYIPNGVTIGTTQGFSNSNVSIYYPSTNSVFLSVQNLPL